VGSDSSVGIVTRLRAGRSGFDSEQGMFFFTTMSRLALGPTEPPIQWVPGAFHLRAMRPGREADHSLLSNAEVKNVWSSSVLKVFFTMNFKFFTLHEI
jgi:hypothetical protein